MCLCLHFQSTSYQQHDKKNVFRLALLVSLRLFPLVTIEVAYILLRFPHLTETFVAEEIQKVQRLGVKVHLVSLLPPRKGPVHPVSEELASQTLYAPNLLSPTLICAQIFFLLKAPRKYIELLRILLIQPAPDFAFLLK